MLKYAPGRRRWLSSVPPAILSLLAFYGRRPEGRAGLEAFGRVSTPFPPTLAEMVKAASGDPATAAKMVQSPQFQEFSRTAQHFQASVTSDGTVTAENIPSGTFELRINIMDAENKTKVPVLLCSGRITFTVPDDPKMAPWIWERCG